jgi:hypothetical protein
MFASILAALRLRQEYINSQLISELVNLEKQQTEKLDSLQQNIESLQIGPFHSGMACLADAKKEHRTHKERYELVQQAKQHFITSLGIYEGKTYKDFNDYFALGYIKSYIAFSWALLNKRTDARDWLIESKDTLNLAYELQKVEGEKLDQIAESLYDEYKSKDLKRSTDPLSFVTRGSIERAFNRWSIASDKYSSHLKIAIQIDDYRKFVQQAIEIIEKEELPNPSPTPSLHQNIVAAQKFMTDLAKSETVKNDKLKSNFIIVSNFLDKITKE